MQKKKKEPQSIYFALFKTYLEVDHRLKCKILNGAICRIKYRRNLCYIWLCKDVLAKAWSIKKYMIEWAFYKCTTFCRNQQSISKMYMEIQRSYIQNNFEKEKTLEGSHYLNCRLRIKLQ